MLKILQTRLQQYMNHELPDQAGFRKDRGTRGQIASIRWMIEKARELWKNIYFFTDYTKAYDWVDHKKLWKILKEMQIADHLICNWERSTSKLYIVTLLIYLICRVHHVKCWVGWSTSGITIVGRNINNLRYSDETTLIAESKEELKSLLIKVKEESEKVGLKLNI